MQLYQNVEIVTVTEGWSIRAISVEQQGKRAFQIIECVVESDLPSLSEPIRVCKLCREITIEIET